jgi:hypothetical protein
VAMAAAATMAAASASAQKCLELRANAN